MKPCCSSKSCSGRQLLPIPLCRLIRPSFRPRSAYSAAIHELSDASRSSAFRLPGNLLKSRSNGSNRNTERYFVSIRPGSLRDTRVFESLTLSHLRAVSACCGEPRAESREPERSTSIDSGSPLLTLDSWLRPIGRVRVFGNRASRRIESV